MPIYEVDGRQANVRDHAVGMFLKEYPNAKLVDNTPYYLRNPESTPQESSISSAARASSEKKQASDTLNSENTPPAEGFARRTLNLPEVNLPKLQQRLPIESKPIQEVVGESMRNMPLDRGAAYESSLERYRQKRDFIGEIQNDKGLEVETQRKLTSDYVSQVRPGTTDTADLDKWDISPEARLWLEQNAVVQKIPIYDRNGFVSGYKTVKQNTPEQIELVKDFEANTVEGQRLYQEQTAYIDSLLAQLDELERLNTERGLEIRGQYKDRDDAVLQAYRRAPAPPAYMPTLPSDEALTPINLQSRKIDEARRTIAAYRDSKNKGSLGQFFGEFGRGLPLMIEDIASFGLKGLKDNLDIKAVVDQYNKGGYDSLSNDEKRMLTSMSLGNAIQDYYEPTRTVPQDVAQGLEHSIPYMASFGVLSSPAKMITRGATQATKGAIAKSASNAMRSGTNRAIAKGLARTAGAGVGTTDIAARATLMSLMDPRTYSLAVENMNGESGYDVDSETGKIVYTGQEGEYDAWGALGKSIATQTIENFAEHTGIAFSRAAGIVKGAINKTAPALGKLLSGTDNQFFQGVNKLMERVGFNGTVEEFLEEQVSTILNAAFTGEAQWSDLVDARQQWVTLLTVASIGSGAAVANTAGNQIAKYTIKHNYENSLKEFDRMFSGSDSPLSERDIQSLKDIFSNGTIDQQKVMLNAAMMSDASEEQKAAIFSLYSNGLKYQALKGVNEGKVEQAVADIPALIEENANHRMRAVVTAKIGGIEAPVQVKDGNIAHREDGSIDRENSDKQVFYVDENGNTQVAPIDLVEALDQNIPIDQAKERAIRAVAEPMVAQMENEEVRPYEVGETVRISLDDTTSLIGQIQGQDESGNYMLSIETPNGIHKMTVEPRKIINEDNIKGVENGSPVTYLDENGDTQQGIVDDAYGLRNQGLIVINGKTTPVANILGLVTENPAEAVRTDPMVSQPQSPNEADTKSTPTIQLQTAPIESPVEQPVEPRTFEIDKGLTATEAGDGTYSLNKQYPKSELKKADALVKKLNDDYSDNGLVFEVVQLPRQDANNPFEKPLWGITARTQSAPAQGERAPEAQTQPAAESDVNTDTWSKLSHNQKLQAIEPLVATVRDQILYGIASGRYKFRWSDTPSGSPGLASELGLSGSEAERRAYINILSKDGYTCETLAEELVYDITNGGRMDSMEIRDEIIDVLFSVRSNRQAVEVLHDRLIGNETDYMQGQLEAAEYTAEIRAEEESNVGAALDKQIAESSEYLFNLAKELGVTLDELSNTQTEVDLVSLIEQLEDGRAEEDIYSRRGEANEGEDSAYTRQGQEAESTIQPLGERDRPGETERNTGESPNREEHGETSSNSDSELSADEQRVVDEANAELDSEIKEVSNQLQNKRAEFNATKRRIGEAYAEDNQTSLFEQEQTPEGLFEVARDFSQSNVNDILEPIQREVDALTVRLNELNDSREERVNNALDNYRRQGSLFSKAAVPEFNGNIIEFIENSAKNVEVAAAEAETSTNPSEAQIEAGNYKKGKVTIQGFDISIEQPRGSVRSGVDENGKSWSVTMNNTYGYIRKTESKDGEHIDVFLGNNPQSPTVFIVDQVNPNTGGFDEHKVMLGFNSIEEAQEAYLSNYEEGWQGMGSITGIDIDTFRKWANSEGKRIKPFAEYKGINESPSFQFVSNNPDSWYERWATQRAARKAEIDKDKDGFYNQVTDKVRAVAEKLGLKVGEVQKSNTDIGQSWYIPVEGLANFRIRVSDHNVGKWRAHEPQIDIYSNIEQQIASVFEQYFAGISGINPNNFHSSTADAKQKFFEYRNTLRGAVRDTLGITPKFQYEANHFKPIGKRKFNALINRLKESGLAKEVVTDKAQFDAKLDEVLDGKGAVMRNRQGNVYGFVTPNGVVHLDSSKMNANTPIHEFGHLWNSFIKENNPELWARGVELIRESQYWQRVNDNPAYAGLNDERRADEALAMAIGDKGEIAVNSGNILSAISIRKWLSDAWNWIKSKLSIAESANIEDMTLGDFTDLAVGQLLGGNSVVEAQSIPAKNLERIAKNDIFVENEKDKGTEARLDNGRTMGRNTLREALGNATQDRRITEAAEAGYGWRDGRAAEEGLPERWDKNRFLGRLEVAARENGSWIDDIGSVANLDKKLNGGYESEVYEGKDGKNVIKLNNLNFLNDNDTQYERTRDFDYFVERIAAHNELFPKDKYEIIGFAENSLGQVSVVMSQPFVEDAELATNEQADEYLQSIGFRKANISGVEGMSGYTNGRYELSDIKPQNVLIDKGGNLRFIDLDITVTPANDTLSKQEISEMEQIKKRSIEDGTFMKAPNGEPTNLTERQWLQVRTSNFKEWFGDWENDPENASKVVDENGEPMVVYHGSGFPGEFTKFDTRYLGINGQGDGRGFYFTDDVNLAEGYRSLRGSLYSVFLNLRNPLNRAKKTITKAQARRIMKELNALSIDEGESVEDGFLSNYADVREVGINGAIEAAMSEYESSDSDVDFIGALSKLAGLKEAYSALQKVTGQDGVIIPKYEYIAGAPTDVLSDTHYVIMDPSSIKSATANTGEFSRDTDDIRFQSVSNVTEPGSLRDRLDNALSSLSFKIREAAEDQHLAVKVLFNELRADGAKIAGHDDFYEMVTAIAGKNDEERKLFKNTYFIPLLNEVSKIQKAGFEGREIDNYILAKHGVERNEVMRKENEDSTEKDYSGVTAIEEEVGVPVQDFIADFEQRVKEAIGDKAINELWSKINKATEYAIDKMYKSGLITPAHYKDVKNKYEYYVPLRGHDQETAEDVYDLSPDAGVWFSNPLEKAKGRTTRAASPWAYIESMAASAIMHGNKNMLKQAIWRLAQQDKTGIFSAKDRWFRVDNKGGGNVNLVPVEPEYSADPEKYQQNIEDFYRKMEDIEAAEKHNPINDRTYVRKNGTLDIGLFTTPAQKEHFGVNVKVGGKEYTVYINADPKIARAITGRNVADRSELLEKLAPLNRWMRANFTTRNPIFILTNGFRDFGFASQMLIVKEGGKYAADFQINYWSKAYPALARYVSGKSDLSKAEDRALVDFIINGGRTGYSTLTQITKIDKDIQRQLKLIGDSKSKAKQKAKDAILAKGLFDVIEKGNDIVENAVRFATFLTSREHGRSVQRSVSDAKDVTINFNRKGTGAYGVKYIRGAYLFANAAIQGLAITLKVGAKHPWKMAAVLTMNMLSGAFIAPMLAYLFGGDDGLEEYMNLGDWERGANFCIYTPEGFVKIPIAHEFRVFHKLGDNAFMWMTNRKDLGAAIRDGLVGFADLLPLNPAGPFIEGQDNPLGMLMEVMTPDAAKPFTQLALNRNFMGTSIYNSWADSELPGHKKAKTNKKGEYYAPYFLVKLSELASDATGGNAAEGGVISPNPDILNHFFKGYLGGFYTAATQTIDAIYKGIDQDLDVRTRDWPIKTFFADKDDLPPLSQSESERYYKIESETRATIDRVKRYEKAIHAGEMSVTEVAKRVSEDGLVEAQRIDKAIKEIKKLEKDLSQTTGEEQKALEFQIANYKRQVIETVKGKPKWFWEKNENN